jgi:DNA-directed RNA polymerase specialized sigma24 family protein
MADLPDRISQYSKRLVGLARVLLHRRAAQSVGPEDIVGSLLCSVLGRIDGGNLEIPEGLDLGTEEGLWVFLAQGVRRHWQKWVKRDARRPVVSLSGSDAEEEKGDQEGLASDPPAERAAALAEVVARWLAALDDGSRRAVAGWREGLSTDEIANLDRCSRRTIQVRLEEARRLLEQLLA